MKIAELISKLDYHFNTLAGEPIMDHEKVLRISFQDFATFIFATPLLPLLLHRGSRQGRA